MKVLIIDNYDSFTYNLYQMLSQLGREVIVARNDAIDLPAIKKLAPKHIVLSPGPGRPEKARDFGICSQIIERLAPIQPILGVCLGHQGIAHALGANIVTAPKIVHGKTSMIFHNGKELFSHLPQPMEATRYHSLMVDRESLPPELEVTAESEDKLVMAIAHITWPLRGVQFHPESIGTPAGYQLLGNFLHIEANRELDKTMKEQEQKREGEQK